MPSGGALGSDSNQVAGYQLLRGMTTILTPSTRVWALFGGRGQLDRARDQGIAPWEAKDNSSCGSSQHQPTNQPAGAKTIRPLRRHRGLLAYATVGSGHPTHERTFFLRLYTPLPRPSGRFSTEFAQKFACHALYSILCPVYPGCQRADLPH